ncbi:spinster family MFS transporter [Pontixanthobacter sp.]|uniref:spinster family MFS transporter n=1 Tax=Pontixanthobacter sp. TaxID=2792078 RepID=UPI003C7D207B
MQNDSDIPITQATPPADDSVPPYSWYALSVLVVIYVLNFIDRQIMSILANDIKADLGIDDAYLGFLYGTAFAIFYALFGIPLGRLADSWKRVRLMTIGLTLWSAMTVISGFARDAATLTFARVGVGVGEASASPAAYSLISDWFPARIRATALAIYSSGIYIGGGLSLFIGGVIVESWNNAYPGGGPLDLVGWQAAFIAVGLPGLLLALWVITLKEPVRGATDGIHTEEDPHPFRGFFQEMMTVIPPFTILGAAKRGKLALAINLAVLSALFVTAIAITNVLAMEQGRILGLITDTITIADQWLFMTIGCYAVFCWATNLRARDLPTFKLTWGSPAFLCTILGYGTVAFIAYSASFFTAPYAERVFDISKADLGLYVGGPSAVAGFAGVVLGGWMADALVKKYQAGRIFVILFGLLSPVPVMMWQFSTSDLTTFLILAFFSGGLASSALGAAAASSQALVLPRMRGAATATFFLSTTLVGLALGPFLAGYVSAQNGGDLAKGVTATLWIAPVGLCLLLAAIKLVPQAGKSMIARAKMAGESGL